MKHTIPQSALRSTPPRSNRRVSAWQKPAPEALIWLAIALSLVAAPLVGCAIMLNFPAPAIQSR